MSRATLRAALAGERVVHGFSLRYAEPGILERIGAGWDFAWLDLQHGDLDLKDVAALARVADLVDVALLVRAPESGVPLGRLLDLDVAGIIAPLVHDTERARDVVRQTRFPPLGDRSFGGRRVIDRRGATYAETSRSDERVGCQIESPAAVSQARAIAALEGVDFLMPGPDDLALRRGIDDPAAAELALQAGRAACAVGKAWLAVVPDLEGARRARAEGATLVSLGSDHVFLSEGAGHARAALHSLDQVE